jgi:hypothetical protein
VPEALQVGSALRRVLPFAFGLAAGVALAALAGREGGRPAACDEARPADSRAAGAWVPTPLPTVHRELPEVHVLSPMLMSEVFDIERRYGRGTKYEAARIVWPHGVAYTAARAREYRQGVLQVNFLFGADGKISEVTPVERRVQCGLCLEWDRQVHSEKVVRIGPDDPRLREYLEAAAEALRRIEFVPTTVNGEPYPTHGFAECVFRLEQDGEAAARVHGRPARRTEAACR